MSVAGALRLWRTDEGPNRRIGRLFMAGSFCFALASLPGASSFSDKAAAVVYFVGSIFFTAAAAETLRTVEAGDRLDLVASAVQLAGTILFNLSTYDALDDHLDDRSTDLLVWTPDAIGSICFLVASAIAVAAVRRARSGQATALDRRARIIAALNMLGSVAFGVSAIAALVVPDKGDALDAAAAASFTLIGAICFLIAAFMLVPRKRA